MLGNRASGVWTVDRSSAIIGSPETNDARWSSPVAREAHNLEVTGSNPVRATCFDGSETRLPSGYTRGRHLRVTAFLRSIASCGNDFERRLPSRSLPPSVPRGFLRRPTHAPVTPILRETLGRLSVSPSPGYTVLRAINRSRQTFPRQCPGHRRSEIPK